MGRHSYSDRWTVEDCKTLSVKFLNKHHYFDGGVRSGKITWSRHGEEIGNISIVVSTVQGDEYIRFYYTSTVCWSGEKSHLDYKARLVSTPCYFGGHRWWFICPLIINGQPCNQRVGVLYLGSEKYFGCRHCLNLTYVSSKESHQFDRMFRKMGIDPKEAKEIFKHKWL